MKKEYYIQAANSVKGMAISRQKRQTKLEKETQALFFWILKFFENDIKYANVWKKKEHKYCLEIKNYNLGNSIFNHERLQCHADRYSCLFIHNEEFTKVIKKVVNIFNSIKGYKAEYFDFAKFGDIIIRITLNVEELEGK